MCSGGVIHAQKIVLSVLLLDMYRLLVEKKLGEYFTLGDAPSTTSSSLAVTITSSSSDNWTRSKVIPCEGTGNGIYVLLVGLPYGSCNVLQGNTLRVFGGTMTDGQYSSKFFSFSFGVVNYYFIIFEDSSICSSWDMHTPIELGPYARGMFQTCVKFSEDKWIIFGGKTKHYSNDIWTYEICMAGEIN